MRYIRRKFLHEALFICEDCYPTMKVANQELGAFISEEFKLDGDWYICGLCGKKEKEKQNDY